MLLLCGLTSCLGLVSFSLFFRASILEPDLDTSRSHLQFLCELIPEGGIGFRFALEDIFEGPQLGTGCSFPVLDLVWGVRIESTKIRGKVWGGRMVGM